MSKTFDVSAKFLGGTTYQDEDFSTNEYEFIIDGKEGSVEVTVFHDNNEEEYNFSTYDLEDELSTDEQQAILDYIDDNL